MFSRFKKTSIYFKRVFNFLKSLQQFLKLFELIFSFLILVLTRKKVPQFS